jgi:hypothetical protein
MSHTKRTYNNLRHARKISLRRDKFLRLIWLV